jgi:hypothetical protein
MTRRHFDDEQQSPAEEIADLLGELFRHVETVEKVLRYRKVQHGGREVAILDWVLHRTRAPGLVDQLGVIVQDGSRSGVVIPGAAVPGGSPGWDDDGALSPMAAGGTFESSPPVADAFWLADDIERQIADLDGELRAQGHRGHLVDIALDDPQAAQRILRHLRALVTSARIALDYDAPIVTLRDVYCPQCGGELRVRADASSAVWCAGRLPLHGPALEGAPWPIGDVPCGTMWPRGSWVWLLETIVDTAG